jgi:hypothetical protein
MGEARHKMHSLLGLLIAELLSTSTCGIFFKQERILLQNTGELSKCLRSATPLDPVTLAAKLTKG